MFDNRLFPEIETPALLVDLDRLERNIQLMAEFGAKTRVALRPHVKTHKCVSIARMQLDAGAVGLTCAKLAEAEVMADAGLTNLLIACPVVGDRKIERLMNLARRVKVIVTADMPDHLYILNDAASVLQSPLPIMIEVDIGLHRGGVISGRPALELVQLIESLPGLSFAGLFGYEGHCMSIKDPVKRSGMVDKAVGKLDRTRQLLVSHDIAVPIVSGGGTATYRFTGSNSVMTEIQPGSYALMDASYSQIEPAFETALTVLATVISRQGDRLILDAGYKCISVDHSPPMIAGSPSIAVEMITEEATCCRGTGTKNLKLGDRLQLITGHCCGTSNLHDKLYAVRGHQVEAVWRIEARGKS